MGNTTNGCNDCYFKTMTKIDGFELSMSLLSQYVLTNLLISFWQKYIYDNIWWKNINENSIIIFFHIFCEFMFYKRPSFKHSFFNGNYNHSQDKGNLLQIASHSVILPCLHEIY